MEEMELVEGREQVRSDVAADELEVRRNFADKLVARRPKVGGQAEKNFHSSARQLEPV